MSRIIVRKRSVSPSAEIPWGKHPRVSLTPYKPNTPTTSITTHGTSTRIRIRIRIKPKTTQRNPAPGPAPAPAIKQSVVKDFQKDLAPAIKQSAVKDSQLQKSVARDPLGKIRGADNNTISISIRPEETNKPAQLPKSATRDSFRICEAPENDAVALHVQSDTTGEGRINPKSLNNQFTSVNSSLQLLPPRNPAHAFGPAERMAIARWMQSKKAVSPRGKHVAAFQDLLHSLGCQDPSFDAKILSKFKNRVKRCILKIKKALKECGAISFGEDDELEKMPVFADWTIVWLEKDWDGVYDTRREYKSKYSHRCLPVLEGEDEIEFILLPVDEPLEEEEEILVVEDPNEIQANNDITNTGAATIRDQEYCCNPYGMTDWEYRGERLRNMNTCK
ncbi:hypothetical protein DSL72_008117 [Monilinia vaccinii-corymbosi]|uniref:Uncharacterized protein n=1 Tax=Monilinia vaccinii-corymbosi TaxID=61207 RepID=A0A8A3PIZ8_9HELO|nr:hypothetical protein DSL72_008117 [Monilinia vaccinii-corymbosi]